MLFILATLMARDFSKPVSAGFVENLRVWRLLPPDLVEGDSKDQSELGVESEQRRLLPLCSIDWCSFASVPAAVGKALWLRTTLRKKLASSTSLTCARRALNTSREGLIHSDFVAAMFGTGKIVPYISNLCGVTIFRLRPTLLRTRNKSGLP